MSDWDRGALVRDRLDIVRRLVDEHGAPAALLSTRRNFAWVTVGGENHVVLGSEQGVAALLVTPDRAIVLTATNEAARIAEEELDGLPIAVHAVPWHDATAMDAAAVHIAGGEPLDDAALEPHVGALRPILSEPETDRMAWLAERATAVAQAAVEAVERGTSEHEVAGFAVGRLAAEGIRAPVVLAAADDRIARFRHPLPTGARVDRRLMLVLVVERWGIHAAVTRFAELATLDPEIARRVEAVDRIHDAMVAATLPGRTLGDVLDAARDAYAAAGHADEWELHHQGGVIGYAPRERIATPGDRTVIHAGMAFAWNPSITGAKAEETIVVTGEGARVLTTR